MRSQETMSPPDLRAPSPRNLQPLHFPPEKLEVKRPTRTSPHRSLTKAPVTPRTHIYPATLLSRLPFPAVLFLSHNVICSGFIVCCPVPVKRSTMLFACFLYSLYAYLPIVCIPCIHMGLCFSRLWLCGL